MGGPAKPVVPHQIVRAAALPIDDVLAATDTFWGKGRDRASLRVFTGQATAAASAGGKSREQLAQDFSDFRTKVISALGLLLDQAKGSPAADIAAQAATLADTVKSVTPDPVPVVPDPVQLVRFELAISLIESVDPKTGLPKLGERHTSELTLELPQVQADLVAALETMFAYLSAQDTKGDVDAAATALNALHTSSATGNLSLTRVYP